MTEEFPAKRFVRLPQPIRSLESEEVLMIYCREGQRYLLLSDGTLWRMKKLKARADLIVRTAEKE